MPFRSYAMPSTCNIPLLGLLQDVPNRSVHVSSHCMASLHCQTVTYKSKYSAPQLCISLIFSASSNSTTQIIGIAGTSESALFNISFFHILLFSDPLPNTTSDISLNHASSYFVPYSGLYCELSSCCRLENLPERVLIGRRSRAGPLRCFRGNPQGRSRHWDNIPRSRINRARARHEIHRRHENKRRQRLPGIQRRDPDRGGFRLLPWENRVAGSIAPPSEVDFCKGRRREMEAHSSRTSTL